MAGSGNQGGGRGRDPTIIRPTPGGSAGPRPVAQVPGASVAAASPAVLLGTDSSVDDFLVGGINPILAAAGPLLSLAVTIGASVQQADVEGLRSRAVDAVRAFEAKATRSGVDADDVRRARYIICTFVDTAIFHTPWGGHENWGARSLLVLFKENTQGGKVFFDLLKQLQATPDRFLDLLELQYVCLALGFQGRYRDEPNGAADVSDIQDRLFRLIREKRPGPGPVLSAHWQGLSEPKPKAWRILPWWVVAVAAACVLLGLLVMFHKRLNEIAEKTNTLMANRSEAAIDYTRVPEATPVANRLKTLLATQESAKQLSIEEIGNRTVVTLTIPDLFQSGASQITPGHEALFSDIGHALAAVPGRVIIVGHTDDQPVRSLSFDNFELSRRRALAVEEVIKPLLGDHQRIESVGLGSTRPRFEPASLPDNRARNRRVEIQHIGE